MNDKSKPIIIIGALLLGLALFALGVLIGQTKNSQYRISLLPSEEGTGKNNSSFLESGGTISVQGDSEIWVKPDIAVLSVGIVACSSDTREANQIINDSLENIVNHLVETGIPEGDLVPSAFSMSPDYKDASKFCAENRLSIVTEDFEQVSELLDIAIAAGATNVYGVQFTVKDTTNAREEAINLAYEIAVQQAEQTADLLGYPLGNVIRSDVQIRDYVSTSIPGNRGGGGAVAPQDGKLQASIELIYELLP
jgi:uncharacterized protein